jgi:hypothetical protein
LDDSRRKFIRTAAYIAPAVLTLAVAPAYAKAGSTKDLPPGLEKRHRLPPGLAKEKKLVARRRTNLGSR